MFRREARAFKGCVADLMLDIWDESRSISGFR